MKLPDVAGIIEFSSERIMASTYKIVVLSAVLLACLSSSSAVVRKRDVDVSENFEKHISHDAQQFPREKRREEIEEFFKETNYPVRLDDKFLEPEALHDSKVIEETTGQSRAERKDKEREDAFHTNNDAEKSDENDMFSYKNIFSYKDMHDVIQAFILADKEGIFDKPQLEEIENSTESEGHNNLPKRHIGVSAAAAAAAAVSSDLLGGNLWEAVPLANLDAHSCGVEAFEYGHVHISGVIVHEFFCELRKFWHYLLIVVRNIEEGLTLGPLIADDVGSHVHHGIFGHVFSRSPLLLQAIIRHPHHLLTLPEIIHDAIPIPSVIGAIHRVAHILLRLVHFVNKLIVRHVFHIIRHVLLHNHFGAFLREMPFAKLDYFSSLFPIEQIVTEPVVSVSSAVASATATDCQGGSVVIPDYQTSLAEVMTSFRGIQDGYRASGIPHLIRTGAKSFSSSSVISFIRPYLSGMPNFASYFGCQPALVQDTAVSTSSSTSVNTLVGPTGPAISPTIIPLAPVEPEIISSSASASAAVVAAETPLISAAPVPYVPAYPPLFERIPTVSSVIPMISPVIIPDAIGNTVAESSASSVAVTAPEIAGNIFNTLGNTGAAAAASASASSLGVAPTSIINPYTLPRYRPRPVLSISRPTIESTASSSASASSSSDIAVEPYQNGMLNWNGYNRFRYPLIRSRVLPSVDSSIAAASSAAASASDGLSSSVASSSASSAVSSALNGFNLVFPREKIVNALGYDCLQTGDIVTVTLRNRSTLFGRVFDATSPITFNLLRPKLHASIIRNGRRIWNLLPRDFRDPEYIQKLNDPLLLRNLY